MKRNITINDLDQISFFKTLSALQIEQLSRSSEVRSFDKNEIIYHDNDEIKNVYIILDGAVKLGMNASNGKTLIKNIVYQGEIFGENIFTHATHRKEFAEVFRNVELLKIPSHVFKNLVASNHQLAQNITKIIIERLQNLEERLQSFVFKKAKTRIMDFIKKTAQLKGVKIGFEEVFIHHGMSHKEIAYLTDTSRQTVARVLGELKNDNLIHFSPRKPSKILVRNLLAFG